jgi:hypothetical protein
VSRLRSPELKETEREQEAQAHRKSQWSVKEIEI